MGGPDRPGEVGQAALAGAQQFAAAAQPQILLGDDGSRPRCRAGSPAGPWRSRPAARRRAAGRSSAASPRPTRPRSWCSWARPKRSACSITITRGRPARRRPPRSPWWPPACRVAPAAKSRHHRVLARPPSCGRAPGRRASPNVARKRRGALLGGGEVAASRTPRPAGRPSRPGRRRRAARPTAADHLVAAAPAASRRVSTGWRPGGFSSRRETSMSP